MQNLAKAIENRKTSLALAKASSRKLQSVISSPYPSMYFDEFNDMTVFYQNLNRYFLTYNASCLSECYKNYLKLEDQGWVIERGKLVNLLFKRCASKIESIVEEWFYYYAVKLNFEWLESALQTAVQAELEIFKNLRLRAEVKPTPLSSFSKQIKAFPEMRLFYFAQHQKEDYLKFTISRLTAADWDYRNPVIYNGLNMHSTEVNVPSIEVDLNEVVYDKAVMLGLDWANKYITEPTAKNSFIKINGIQAHTNQMVF